MLPLLIIVLLSTFILGTIKLSEWRGRQLKLLSGLMMASFGAFFIISYQLIENPVTPIALHVMSPLLTLLISYLWKRHKKELKENNLS
jgi:uncharacterized membrane protein